MKNAMQFIDSFFRSPLLIEGTSLRMIIAAMNARAGLSPALESYRGGSSQNVTVIPGGIAVIPVLGVLTYRSGGLFSFLFGDTSYQEIRQNFRQALADQSVSTIVFDHGSPGGTAEGIFDLVDEIYQARGTKPIYAIVNEFATSGSYAIASAADKIFIPRTGRTGSIGVRAVHIDESGMNEAMGLKYTEIYAGDHKTDGTPNAPLSPEALAEYQKMVDQSMDIFVETVARNRGIKASDVRAQQAAIYSGKEAVAAGLADVVMSWDAAIKKIMGSKTNKGGSMKAKLQALFEGAPKETVAAALAEMGYVPKMEGGIALPAGMIPALAAALGIDAVQLGGDLTKIDFTKLGAATVASAVSAAEARVKTETLAYVNGIHDICALAGQEKMAPAMIQKGTTVEAARTEVMAAKAAGTERTQIRSTVSGLSTGEVNPVVADAKKRAGVK